MWDWPDAAVPGQLSAFAPSAYHNPQHAVPTLSIDATRQLASAIEGWKEKKIGLVAAADGSFSRLNFPSALGGQAGREILR